MPVTYPAPMAVTYPLGVEGMSDDRVGLESDADTDDLDLDLDDLDDASEPEADAPGGPKPEEGEGSDQRQPQTGRADQKIRAYKQRLREQEAELRRFREDRDRLIQAPPPQDRFDPARQAELDRQELDRVMMLPPHEQAQYYTRRTEERLTQQFQRQQLDIQDRMDRQAFQQTQRDEPAARRLSAEVESTLAVARRNGMNPTRDAIYNLLLGQELRSRSHRESERQRRRGQQRIASQATQPNTGRSTVSPSRRGGSQETSDEELLRGVTLGDYLQSV